MSRGALIAHALDMITVHRALAVAMAIGALAGAGSAAVWHAVAVLVALLTSCAVLIDLAPGKVETP